MFSSNQSSEKDCGMEKCPSNGIPGDPSAVLSSHPPLKRPRESYPNPSPADTLALARLPPKNGEGSSSTLILTSAYFPASVQVKPAEISVPAGPVAAPAFLEDPRLARKRSRSNSSSSASPRSSSGNSSPLAFGIPEPLVPSVGKTTAAQMLVIRHPGLFPGRGTENAQSSNFKPMGSKPQENFNSSHKIVAGAHTQMSTASVNSVTTVSPPETPTVHKPAVVPVPVPVLSPQTKPDLNETMRPHLDWIQSQPLSQISLAQLSIWKKLGSVESVASFEPKFCDVRIYEELIKQKTYYHTKLTTHEAQSSRARSNPFERIENGIFQNRAGMKLANIDADLNFFLSDPRRPDGSHVVGSSDILNFVDICGGPGGFAEYLLHRRGFETKGFGITLRDSELDFNLREFQAGPSECYEVFYGDMNNGDIYDPVNVKSFIDLVLHSTDKQGVHLALADGGIEVKGDEFLMQENICKKLYLSQFLIGLSVLSEGGTFVCKLFETNTKFTVGLIYLLHLCFDQVTIYKPRMSRPQNSERYIVCLNRRPRSGTEPVTKYFTECHQLMWEWSTTNRENHLQRFDLDELVPMEILLQKQQQKNYKDSFSSSAVGEFAFKMQRYNSTIMKNQCDALRNLRLFVSDSLLQHEGQTELRKKCCEEWRVPLLEDRRPKRRDNELNELTNETFSRLWQKLERDNGFPVRLRDLKERKLTLMEFDNIFKSPYDWRIVVVQGNATTFKQSRGFYMSQGGTDVFRYNVARDEWEEAPISIELPKDTLIFGECVQEFEGYGNHQKKKRVFHIIDALVINGKDLRNHHYIVRHEFINKLARAVSKGSRGDLSLVRAKQLVRMENIADVLDKCDMQQLKGEAGLHWTCPIDHTDERSSIIKAAGILFLKLTKDPWMMTVNDRNHRKYWLNLKDGSSTYDFTPLAVSSFLDTMRERTMWNWTESTKLEVPDPALDQKLSPQKDENNPDTVHSYHFLQKKYSRPHPQPHQGQESQQAQGHSHHGP